MNSMSLNLLQFCYKAKKPLLSAQLFFDALNFF